MKQSNFNTIFIGSPTVFINFNSIIGILGTFTLFSNFIKMRPSWVDLFKLPFDLSAYRIIRYYFTDSINL